MLRRARECSALTIPGLLPPDGHDENDPLPTPYQSVGAQGVNNLAAKLVLALFAPGHPFFRMTADKMVLERMAAEDPSAPALVQKALSKVERAIMEHLERTNLRVTLYEVLRHLLTTGNVLLHIVDADTYRVFRLDQYVVSRDRSGTVLEIVIKESVSPWALPGKVIKACDVDVDPENSEKNVDVYTHIRRDVDGNRWSEHQEINGVKVPDSEGSQPLQRPAYLPLRANAIPSSDYGRGLVDEHFGDLKSLEGLSKAIVELAAVAAKVVVGLDPNSQLRATELQRTEQGDIVTAKKDDIWFASLDKLPDFRMAAEVTQTLERRLAKAFLLTTSVQRDAERVTAQEIRLLAKELEDALGGLYSILAQELQMPLIKRVYADLERRQKIPPLPDGVVNPTIVTGAQALGRGNDLMKLRSFLEHLGMLPEERVYSRIDIDNIVTRIATAEGIDIEGLMKSEEQLMREQRQQQMAQMVQESAPGVAQEAVKQAGAQLNNG